MFALIAFTFAVGTGLFIFAAVETSEAYGRHRRRKHAIEAAEERDLERFLAAMRDST